MLTLTPTEREAALAHARADIEEATSRYQTSATTWNERKRQQRKTARWEAKANPVEVTRPMPVTRYTCDICQDRGIVKASAVNGKYGLDGWRYDLKPCACRSAEYAQRKATRIKSASNLTPEMERMTFATYDRAWDAEAYVATLGYAQSLIGDTRDFAPFLILSGTYGSGKTHLLAAIAHKVMPHGRQPLFTVVPSLMDWFRAGFDPDDKEAKLAFQTRFDGICNADILLLDDLGAERSTIWVVEKLFQLINHRYARDLPTVISTNCTPDQFDGRIADRLMDLAKCQHVYTVEKSFRQQQARAKQRNSSKKGA